MIAACGNSNPHNGHFDYARRRPCVGNIGRPIVAMTELPHYPSSAELAAFRRSIPVGSHPHGPVPAGDIIGWMATLPALPHEREHGIGYNVRTRAYGPADWWTEPFWSGIARSMAAAQRTARYSSAYWFGYPPEREDAEAVYTPR